MRLFSGARDEWGTQACCPKVTWPIGSLRARFDLRSTRLSTNPSPAARSRLPRTLFSTLAVLAALASQQAQARNHSPSGHASTHAHSTSGHRSTGSKATAGVARNSHGKIARSAKAKDEFKHGQPCPSTGKASGACPGYVIDHRVPLKRGGPDAPENMQWQSTAAAKAKDRTE
jgi:hypothetical protein